MRYRAEGVRDDHDTGTADGTVSPSVPEPATWGMMIAGFGLACGLMRRRARRVAVGFAG